MMIYVKFHFIIYCLCYFLNNCLFNTGTNIQLTFSPGQLKWQNKEYNKGSIKWTIMNPLYSISTKTDINPTLNSLNVGELMSLADGSQCDAILYVAEDDIKAVETARGSYNYRQLLLADTTGNLSYILNGSVQIPESKVIILKNCVIRSNSKYPDIKYLNSGFMVDPAAAASFFAVEIRDFLENQNDFQTERKMFVDKSKYTQISLRKIRQKSKEFALHPDFELKEVYKHLVVQVKYDDLDNGDDYIYYSKKGDKKRRSISEKDVPENMDMSQFGNRNMKFIIVVKDARIETEEQKFVLFNEMISEFLGVPMDIDSFEQLSEDQVDKLFDLDHILFKFYLNTYIKEYNGKTEWRFNVVAIDRCNC